MYGLLPVYDNGTSPVIVLLSGWDIVGFFSALNLSLSSLFKWEDLKTFGKIKLTMQEMTSYSQNNWGERERAPH